MNEIRELRREYEKLAKQCDKAVADKNQPEIDRLMAAKRDAHTLWHNAVIAQRHAERDAMKAAGRKPGAV